jgi:hypothetical protein
MATAQAENRNIEKVIALCNEMLELAGANDEHRLEEDSAVFYGALRNSAYKLRRLAKNELIRHKNGRQPSSGG